MVILNGDAQVEAVRYQIRVPRGDANFGQGSPAGQRVRNKCVAVVVVSVQTAPVRRHLERTNERIGRSGIVVFAVAFPRARSARAPESHQSGIALLS